MQAPSPSNSGPNRPRPPVEISPGESHDKPTRGLMDRESLHTVIFGPHAIRASPTPTPSPGIAVRAKSSSTERSPADGPLLGSSPARTIPVDHAGIDGRWCMPAQPSPRRSAIALLGCLVGLTVGSLACGANGSSNETGRARQKSAARVPATSLPAPHSDRRPRHLYPTLRPLGQPRHPDHVSAARPSARRCREPGVPGGGEQT